MNRYIYHVAHENFEGNYLLKYRKTEETPDIDAIQHPLFREALRKYPPARPIELGSMADIPSQGSGLGSSSAFCVGLVNLLSSMQGKQLSAEQLAQEAVDIEINRLKDPIGKQDQYAVAYGGLNFIRFNPDESVKVEPLRLPQSTLTELEESLLLVYTGDSRSAGLILAAQRENTKSGAVNAHLQQLKTLALEMRDALRAADCTTFGDLLRRNWESKRQLAAGITNDRVDAIVNAGMKAGAQGAKLLGAGQGGFVLFAVPEGRRALVRQALSDYRQVQVRLSMRGSRMLYDSG